MQIEYKRRCATPGCFKKGSEEYGGKYYCIECHKEIMRNLFEKHRELVTEEDELER